MKKPFKPQRKERVPSLKELREQARYYSKNLARWGKQREIIPRMVRSARANILAAYKAEGIETARKVYESYRAQKAFDEVNELLRVEPIQAILPKKRADKYPLSQEEIKGVRDNLDSFFRALKKRDREKKK